MNSFIVCSFATKNTPYEQVAREYLLPSLINLNIPFDFSLVPSLGSWQKNTSQKPSVALLMLNKHKDKNILLLDVDCRVERPLDLFNNIPEGFNFAAHKLDHKTWYRNNSNVKELISSTLFIRNCQRSFEICHFWKSACSVSSEWEQRVLDNELTGHSEPLYELPLQYFYCDSMPDGTKPFVECNDVVIRAFQASRRYRNSV